MKYTIGTRGMAQALRALVATCVVHGFNPSPWRQRQVHLSEFKVSLVHRASALTAKTTHSSRNSGGKKKQIKKKKGIWFQDPQWVTSSREVWHTVLRTEIGEVKYHAFFLLHLQVKEAVLGESLNRFSPDDGRVEVPAFYV